MPHFCWVARALWHALTTLAFVPWTHYVDDFPTLMFSDLCDDLELLVDGFFSALGFRIKCLPSFAESFRPLGVEFTFPPGRAAVVVSNRESRVADIDEDVRRAFSSGRLSRHSAQTLRGRITFARAQLFGRCSAPAFRALGAVADRTRVSSDDVARALQALVSLVRLLKCGRPREVPAHLPSPWLLYSDGACEPERTGFSGISVGAILFSPGGVAQFFGLEVPRWFMDEIGLAWRGRCRLSGRQNCFRFFSPGTLGELT